MTESKTPERADCGPSETIRGAGHRSPKQRVQESKHNNKGDFLDPRSAPSSLCGRILNPQEHQKPGFLPEQRATWRQERPQCTPKKVGYSTADGDVGAHEATATMHRSHNFSYRLDAPMPYLIWKPLDKNKVNPLPLSHYPTAPPARYPTSTTKHSTPKLNMHINPPPLPCPPPPPLTLGWEPSLAIS